MSARALRRQVLLSTTMIVGTLTGVCRWRKTRRCSTPASTLPLGPRTTAGVSYSGQFGDRVTDNAVKGRFTWLF